MKIGIIISVLIVVIVGGIVLLAFNTPADNPTSKTSPQQLELQALPADLPRLVEIPTTGQGDARDSYSQMLHHYTANAKQLEGRSPSAGSINTLTNHLLAAAQAPMSGEGFFDDQMPAAPGSRPAFGAAMEVLPALALNQALEGKDDSKARRVAQAVWIMGQRAFEQGRHIYIRREGLGMMQLAGSALYRLDKDNPDTLQALQRWSQALGQVAANWDAKIQMIQSVRQPIGDVLNIARHDKDPSFRVNAVTWLGVAKFNPGHRGNEKAILALIASSKADADPAIAAAGQAADAFSREDLRKLH